MTELTVVLPLVNCQVEEGGRGRAVWRLGRYCGVGAVALGAGPLWWHPVASLYVIAVDVAHLEPQQA